MSGVLGSVGGGLLGGLLGSSDQGANTSTSSGTSASNAASKGAFNPDLAPALANLTGILTGSGVSSQPYGGASLATQAGGNALGQQQYLSSFGGIGAVPTAANLATAGATPVSNADINAYLNPYTSDVANYASKLAGQFLTEQALPAVGDTFTMAGQPGSSRQADFTSRAIRDTTTNLQGELGSILGSGFNTALNEANQQKANMFTGAGTLNTLAGQNQNTLQNLINSSLAATGLAGAGTSQNQSASTQTGAATGPSPSILSSILGGALSGGDIFKALGLGGLALPFKDGGPVRTHGYADGGGVDSATGAATAATGATGATSNPLTAAFKSLITSPGSMSQTPQFDSLKGAQQAMDLAQQLDAMARARTASDSASGLPPLSMVSLPLSYQVPQLTPIAAMSPMMMRGAPGLAAA